MSADKEPTFTDDDLAKITEGESISQPSRAQRRRKVKNRQFTKKGFTRVIKRDDDGKMWNIPTPVGSRIHKIAQHNVKKMHKANPKGK